MSFLISSSCHYIYTNSSANNFYFLASFDENLGATLRKIVAFQGFFLMKEFIIKCLWRAFWKERVKKKFKGKFQRHHIKTLPAPIPDEEKKLTFKFLFSFHTSLWCLKRFYETLKGLHKTLRSTTKKCENKNFS